MNSRRPFACLYTHGFARVAVGIPNLAIGNPLHNADRTLVLARRAHTDGAVLVLFPELGLTGYSNDDLFQQDALLDAGLEGLDRIREASRDLAPVVVVGLPVRVDAGLYNCGVVVHRGRILGAVPKVYLPNYREFYEKRQFASALSSHRTAIDLLGQTVPFGSELLFEVADIEGLTFHAEICEDLWVPIPPSAFAALAGGTVLLNLSASNVTIGKNAYRRDLCAGQSGKCIAAYLYAAAGRGESTTDLAWDGHALIYENGRLLAESGRFEDDEQYLTADLDLERLRQDRMRMTSFLDCVQNHRARLGGFRTVTLEWRGAPDPVPLRRPIERFPYVPRDPVLMDERCYEAYQIQVTSLIKRLEAAGIGKLVIGVSGGLDSTQALLVACRAMDRLRRPRTNVLAYTMPGFATGEATKGNAWALMTSLGVSGAEIDIRPSCLQMLRDLDHPFARGEPVHDVTFENVQAGERTSHLFRLANHHRALVLGTGDLSELALGWCTYGVGDHMSHYNVNASVPKTLIQHLIRWVITGEDHPPGTVEVLGRILETEITPELVPAGGASGAPVQSSESVVGPYELQDFNLYYISRYGYRPSKVAYLAHHAWGDVSTGVWPAGFPPGERRAYDLAAIRKWLEVFLFRFFQTSQFKRSALPNGPKVGSGGSLSPRGDWRAPSDSEATAWLDELRGGVPEA